MRCIGVWLLAALVPSLMGCVAPSAINWPARRGSAVEVPTSGTRLQADPMATSRSFFIRGQRFPVGEAASMRVCVGPDGSIASVEITNSSGQPSFDEFALVWARQADVSQWVKKDQQDPSCGSVRVEIGPGTRPRFDRGADTALG